MSLADSLNIIPRSAPAVIAYDSAGDFDVFTKLGSIRGTGRFISNLMISTPDYSTGSFPKMFVQVGLFNENIDLDQATTKPIGQYFQGIVAGYISHPANGQCFLGDKGSFAVDEDMALYIQGNNFSGADINLVVSWIESDLPLGNSGTIGEIYDGEPKLLYEYVGTVTQLAATSEVATIGIKFSVPEGEHVTIREALLVMSDQTTAETARIIPRTTGASAMMNTQIAVDNSSIALLPTNIDASLSQGTGIDGVAEWPYVLGGEQTLNMDSSSTIDAGTTMTMVLRYSSTRQPMTTTVIGSGISISAVVHLAI